MNETKTPDIQAMLEWLADCPFATALNNGDVAFSIDYLGAEPCQFSLESTPTAPILEKYIRGSLRAKNYVLASRMSYTQDTAQQAANSSFWDSFADWVEEQSLAGRLPKLENGKTAEAVVCLSPGYILNQNANTCRFQIQLQLQYYQEGR